MYKRQLFSLLGKVGRFRRILFESLLLHILEWRHVYILYSRNIFYTLYSCLKAPTDVGYAET